MLYALLFLSLKLLNALIRSRHLFGKCRSGTLNCLANLMTHLRMRLIRILFSLYLLTINLLACQTSTESVSGKLITVHPIKNILTAYQSLACLDISCGFATVESFVTVVLKYREIFGFENASTSCRFRKLRIECGHLRASDETKLIFRQLGQFIFKLLTARLNGEVCLPKCNGCFLRISVLYDEIASIS